VKHTDKNIADRIVCVVEEFGLIDKVFSVTLDNASSNAKAIETLTLYVYHIINLIVKSSLKRFKPYI
jgi:hypothetical protein